MVYERAVFWFVVALLCAAMEVESEGKHGWAEKMPTWYRTRGFAATLFDVMTGGKPLTGYHAFAFLLAICVMHAPYVSGMRWTAADELETWARFFIWAPTWDYLWFVLNPAYGPGGIRRAWWHAKDQLVAERIPVVYLFGLSISLILAIVATRLGNAYALADEIITVAAFLALTFATIAFSGSYHWWYYWMRRRDDRDSAGIFHDDSDGS